MRKFIYVEWWCTYCAVIELLILLSRHWIACNCYCMMFCSMLSAYYFVCDVIPLPYHYRLNTFYAAIELSLPLLLNSVHFVAMSALFYRFWCVMQGVTIYWKRNELPTKVVWWEMRKPIVQNFPGIESSISLRQKASSMLQAVSSPRQSIASGGAKSCVHSVFVKCVCACVC